MIRIGICILLFFGFALHTLQAQIQRDTVPDETITYETADSADFYTEGSGIKYLRGNVVIRRDSTFMFCDSARIQDTLIIAVGNVSIIQNDTIMIFADSLVYYPDSLVASLFGNGKDRVVLRNGNQRLFTEALHYDVENKVANYQTTAVLENNRTKLRSQRGTYYVNAKLAKFYDKVLVQDTTFNLWADSLYFETEEEKVIFRGPTRIDVDSSQIYAEKGFYDIPNDYAEFEVNAQYSKEDAKATAEKIQYDGNKKEITLTGDAVFKDDNTDIAADTLIHNRGSEISIMIGNASFKDSTNFASSDKIYYDGKKESLLTVGRSKVVDPPMIIIADFIDYSKSDGAGLARGNVIWQDTSANTTIYCEEIVQDTVTEYIKAYSKDGFKPMMESIQDSDTMYMSADTLLSFKGEDTDTNDVFIAYNRVEIFKTDFRAICDSLVYASADSTFHLFTDPFIWADTTQFSGDSIDIIMKNKKINEVKVKQNGFIIDTPDNQFYNQIKGRFINVFFKESQLDNLMVSGNAESLYYILDSEGAYIGVNKTTCSRINFIFADDELKDIRFYTKPDSKLTPMDKANHNALRLSGFLWNIENKPKSVEMIKIRKE